MIIDEVLDSLQAKKNIDLDYIEEEAELFNYDYITKAIKEKDRDQLKKAIQFYIVSNSYNNNLVEAVNDLKIKF